MQIKTDKPNTRPFTNLRKFNRIDVVKREEPSEEICEGGGEESPSHLLIKKELELSQNSRLFRNTSNFVNIKNFDCYEFNNKSEEIFFESVLSNQELMSPLQRQDSFVQLLKIAEVLLEKPDVLFIDEEALKIKELPNLDYFSLLKQNLPQTYFFVIVNGKENLKNFEMVVIMKNGKISWKGDPKNLKNTKEVLK